MVSLVYFGSIRDGTPFLFNQNTIMKSDLKTEIFKTLNSLDNKLFKALVDEPLFTVRDRDVKELLQGIHYTKGNIIMYEKMNKGVIHSMLISLKNRLNNKLAKEESLAKDLETLGELIDTIYKGITHDIENLYKFSQNIEKSDSV